MPLHQFSELFEEIAQWQVFASGHAEGRLSKITDANGKLGLRLDYDFHGGGGFIAIKRVLPFRLPETFEIRFQLRGSGPRNHFEFKVADPGGTNVWRHLHQDFNLPESWTDHRFNERNLPFAWGPSGGGAPAEIGAVEFVIAAGPGGKGIIDLAAPAIEDQSAGKPLAIRASTQQPEHLAEFACDSNSKAAWRADPADKNPWWSVDYGRIVRFGGLIIHWPDLLPPRACDLEVSADGTSWKQVFRAVTASGSMTHIATPGSEARYLRINFEKPEFAALQAIILRPDSFSRTPNEFIHSVAEDYPRGWFPRYWSREQSYWTPIGSKEGRRRALINEEGMVEVDEAGFSLEPFLLIDGKLVTWAEAETACSLPQGGAPLPSVTWKTDNVSLKISPWVDGKGDNLTLHTTYRVKCRKPFSKASLVVSVRPFQVNPPWQAFRNLGGHSPIHKIQCSHDRIIVDGRNVVATPAPQCSGAAAFEEGVIPGFLSSGRVPTLKEISDDSGFASAAMSWDIEPGQEILEVTISTPYSKEINPANDNSHSNALATWRRTVGEVIWTVPACARPAFDCFRTAAAHILINRDGPAIQPGPRRYTRSWVRDCVIMGAALAKAGQPHALREFLTWYATFQREDGFIPCVVDRDGIDWLVEHDSHGQFIWGVREVIRGDRDLQFLERMMPHVRKAAEYLVALRAERLTPEYLSDEKSPAFGLLPESASHEGYLAHPVHSYWDDFWGVRGLNAAAELTDLTDEAQRWNTEATNFQSDLVRSIKKVISNRQLNYIPGSVEWADFDPTATANAIGMLDFADVLPQDHLTTTLDSYLDGFRRKHSGHITWNNYTAYEIRIIGAFVRLGNREVANELLDFFLSDRRPLEWNQWPEITWRNSRSPGHLGDVPHTWIAAEYILSLASMVAAERDASDSLILASGMPWAWIAEEQGFSVAHLPTRNGLLDFMIRADGSDSILIEIAGTMTLPPGGLSVIPPLPSGTRIISLEKQNMDGFTISSSGDSVAVTSLPFIATLRLGKQSSLA